VIRNGAALRMHALAERIALKTKWQQYHETVQQKLGQLLHDYSLEVAMRATEALEAYAASFSNEEGKEGNHA
jgi:hypothetical protein